MAEGVLIAGKLRLFLDPMTGHPLPVFGPQDHHIEFKPGDGFNKRRVSPVELGVFHWTGGEGSVEGMAETLRQRKLGVHFAISAMGSLYQFCDPTVVNTADASIANARSWGVEIINAGIRSMGNLWREPKANHPPLGPRPSYDTKIHGLPVKCWDFYPAQKLTAFALNKLMVETLSTYTKDVCVYPGVVDIAKAKGAIGHYNVTTQKLDPGTQFMLDLREFMQHGVRV